MMANFLANMREATRLTRSGRLGDATRLIQATLSAPQLGSPPRTKGSSKPKIEAKEQAGLGDSMRDVAHRLTTSFHRLPPGEASQAVLRRPLGETVDLLRKAELSKFRNLPQRPEQHVSVQEGAKFLTRAFASAAGARSYKLFVPSRIGPEVALVVMLHGCTQNANDFAIGTRMNEIAEEYGFVVAYPVQSRTANSLACWNWFNRMDQTRGLGEPALLAELTEELIAEFHVNRSRVFVAGLSAGGAMAAILGTIYADLYAAVGIHSGLNYAAGTDLISAVAAMGGKARSTADRQGKVIGPLTRTIVFHGDADHTVQPANGDAIVAAAKAQLDSWHEEVTPGRKSSGVDYTRTVVRNARELPVIEHWVLHGMGHAWSGGSAAGSFTDAHGPDASREMIRFFLESR